MNIPGIWRFIDTGSACAAWNMAVDEALLENFKEHDLPILRFYGWESSLSLGKFTKIDKTLNKEELEETQFPYVRRMTGGGILVHGGELSYTLVLPRDWQKGKGVKESYRYLCGFLMQTYSRLGYKAGFACDLGLDLQGSDVCLAGSEAYDIMIEGHKMGGNAQRYTRHAVFQHGSIPISMDKARFKKFFLSDAGLQRAVCLRGLGSPIEYEELSCLLRETFDETFGVKSVDATLSIREEERARELLKDKYTQQRWNRDGK